MKKWFAYIFYTMAALTCMTVLWIFTTNLIEAEPNLKVGLLGLFGALAVGLFTHYQTRKREINARHFAEKRTAYRQMVGLLFDMILAAKIGKKITDREMMTTILEFKKGLLIWGDAALIEVWNQYEIDSANKPEGDEVVKRMERVLLAIRKDLGHDDKFLRPGNLAGLLIAGDEKQKFLMGWRRRKSAD